mgnify:CR=1 FL=1
MVMKRIALNDDIEYKLKYKNVYGQYIHMICIRQYEISQLLGGV